MSFSKETGDWASLKGKWPIMGNLLYKGRYFKLESPTLYVDVLANVIEDFVSKLDMLRVSSVEDAYEKAVQLRDSFNEELERDGVGWLKFIVRREVPWARKPLAVRIHIDWGRFHRFLEDFAKEEVSLEKKYQYIYACRYPLASLRTLPYKHHMEDRVKQMVDADLTEVREQIQRYLNEIHRIRVRLRRRGLRHHFSSLTFYYISEISSIFDTINHCATAGKIPTCYREMRKMIENLAWVILDDLFLIKMRRNEISEFIPPLRALSKEWYDWSRSRQITLKTFADLKRRLEPLVDGIHQFGVSNGYQWSKGRIQDVLISNLSYQSFLLLVGIERDSVQPLPSYVRTYEPDALNPSSQEYLKNTLRTLKGSDLLQSEMEYAQKIAKKIERDSTIMMPYPSNEFILGMVGKLLECDLLKAYDKYSYFVHSYDNSWLITPFSSIFELKVFRYEIERFISLLARLLAAYEASMRHGVSSAKMPDFP